MIASRLVLCASAAGVLLASTFSCATAEDSVAVTIYSSADPASFDPQKFIAQQNMGYNPNYVWQVPGFGVIKETRSVDLNAGVNELRFTDVAQFIDPTTVSFTDVTNPDGTTVLEQNFEFDLVNPQKIYEAYIDQNIEVQTTTRDGETITVTGTVLSVNQGYFIIETPAGIEMVQMGSSRLTLPPLPANDLITKPTLVWKLHADDGGQRDIRTTYQTDGITWRSDYNLVLNEDDTMADLGAWVTLMNLSGAAYKNAQLKLIAGDVQRVQPQGGGYGGRMYAAQADMARQAGFEEKSFFEYHMYTLPRKTDILANSTQQLTLFPTARDAEVEKVMVYYGLPNARQWFSPNPQTDRNLGNQSNKKVDVYIRFQNEEENNLGMPLPAGKVRVYKQDPADETLEFIGEDLIDHTPRDEEVLIKIGSAFDVVGERTRTNFEINHNQDWMREAIRIQVRNHKDEPATVIIKENLYRWVNWEIIETNNEDWKKIDARTVHWTVTIPPGGEKTVDYVVKYSW